MKVCLYVAPKIPIAILVFAFYTSKPPLCELFFLFVTVGKHAISGERGAVYTGLYRVWYRKLLFVALSQVKIDVYIGMFNTDMYRWKFPGFSLLEKQERFEELKAGRKDRAKEGFVNIVGVMKRLR